MFEFFVASIFESFDSQSDDGIFLGYLSVRIYFNETSIFGPTNSVNDTDLKCTGSNSVEGSDPSIKKKDSSTSAEGNKTV